jgi:hypothetical protein
MTKEDAIDRLSIRERPDSLNIMQQTWGKLLFMHWKVPLDTLRPRVPGQLEIDTHDGHAWISLLPFTIWNMRASFLPPIPGLSAMHELNVRTYVHRRGTPGIYFFSLDANSAAVVLGARTFFLVPYYNAEMSLKQDGDRINYHSRRTHADAPPAAFEAAWKIGKPMPESQPGSLEFFLAERYCFYTVSGESVYRCRVHHAPWPLQTATVSHYSSTMIEAAGIPEPTSQPLLQYAEELTVDIWPLEKV